MPIRTRTDAEVQIIVVSDDDKEWRELISDLEKSNHRIAFKHFDSQPVNLVGLMSVVLWEQPFLPTAIIVDYLCHGNRCVDMVRDIRNFLSGQAVELVVARVPEGQNVRDELIALGADTVVTLSARLDRCNEDASDSETKSLAWSISEWVH